MEMNAKGLKSSMVIAPWRPVPHLLALIEQAAAEIQVLSKRREDSVALASRSSLLRL